jgi:hypothetical protein
VRVRLALRPDNKRVKPPAGGALLCRLGAPRSPAAGYAQRLLHVLLVDPHLAAAVATLTRVRAVPPAAARFVAVPGWPAAPNKV